MEAGEWKEKKQRECKRGEATEENRSSQSSLTKILKDQVKRIVLLPRLCCGSLALPCLALPCLPSC